MSRASLVLSLLPTFSPATAPGDCPVTLPSSSPVQVPGAEAPGSRGWYGSDALAVLIPKDGRWRRMGPSGHWGDKLWLWRRGYDARTEPQPALTFSGVMLEDHHEPLRLQIDRATGAYGEGWSQMLTGLNFPSAGCWQITARYLYVGITHELTFVLDVVAD